MSTVICSATVSPLGITKGKLYFAHIFRDGRDYCTVINDNNEAQDIPGWLYLNMEFACLNPTFYKGCIK